MRATLPHRDSVDGRIISEVRTGQPTLAAATKGIIKDIEEVGGYPHYGGAPHADMGADGLPLWWKKKYHLDETDPALATRDLAGDGYTVIEKFLAGLDPAQRIVPAATSNTLTAASFASPAEAEYTKKIEARTADILAALAPLAAPASDSTHDAVITFYRATNAWHDANDFAAKKKNGFGCGGVFHYSQ